MDAFVERLQAQQSQRADERDGGTGYDQQGREQSRACGKIARLRHSITMKRARRLIRLADDRGPRRPSARGIIREDGNHCLRDDRRAGVADLVAPHRLLHSQVFDVPQRQWVFDVHHTAKRITSGEELK